MIDRKKEDRDVSFRRSEMKEKKKLVEGTFCLSSAEHQQRGNEGVGVRMVSRRSGRLPAQGWRPGWKRKPRLR